RHARTDARQHPGRAGGHHQRPRRARPGATGAVCPLRRSGPARDAAECRARRMTGPAGVIRRRRPAAGRADARAADPRAQGRRAGLLLLSPECWMSYNGALRAIHAGYTNVLWYRGGIEAWKMAGLPTSQPRQQAASQQQQLNRPSSQTAPLPAKFVRVEPVTRDGGGGGGGSRPGGGLGIGQGKFFAFALPPGWRVGEDGQYALTLLSPDNSALTVMAGNAGLLPNVSPEQFAYQKLSQMQIQNLQFGQERPARPAVGFRQAVEFDL